MAAQVMQMGNRIREEACDGVFQFSRQLVLTDCYFDWYFR